MFLLFLYLNVQVAQASNLSLPELAPVRLDVEDDPVDGSGQGETPDQQDGEDDVWEGCSEVNDLEVVRKKNQSMPESRRCA